MSTLIRSLVRKIIFGAGAVWIAKLVELGIIENADTERIIQIIVAALMVGGSALWSYVVRIIEAKK